MSDIPTGGLFGILAFLILISAFFSGAETAMLSLNRYRLRHLSNKGYAPALRASRLLARPDRLIGLILLGNNFINIFASSIATLIALRLVGEAAIAIAAGIMTLIILIFAEVTPKTLAVLHPERVAFPATYVLSPLLKISYPIVWLVNIIATGLLKLIGVSTDEVTREHLTTEELRTVVMEAAAMIPQRHKSMLINILDLEKVTVEDIMVPRNEIMGIDLNNDWEQILPQLSNSQHTRLPIYRDNIENIIGFLHVRTALNLVSRGELDKESITTVSKPPYFVPEGTPLNTQLLNFQRQQRRIGLVVDEYGDIRGLVTLEDILEEIVGEFTTDVSTTISEVHPQDDGSYLIDGSANIRALNRTMNWKLPTDGPKTLNGLILEHLESIPEAGTSVRIDDYPIEIIQTTESAVKIARINPSIIKPSPSEG
jgi:Mg2+/Co2+ transporter CorB